MRTVHAARGPFAECFCTHIRRFQAVLECPSGTDTPYMLSLVEDTDFNRVAQVVLPLAAADDATLKRFLAFRLAESRAAQRELSAELQDAQVGGSRAWRVENWEGREEHAQGREARELIAVLRDGGCSAFTRGGRIVHAASRSG